MEKMIGFWKSLPPCLSLSVGTNFSTPLTIIVETTILYNFLRRRNDRIEGTPAG
jgi:hypothetical protein